MSITRGKCVVQRLVNTSFTALGGMDFVLFVHQDEPLGPSISSVMLGMTTTNHSVALSHRCLVRRESRRHLAIVDPLNEPPTRADPDATWGASSRDWVSSAVTRRTACWPGNTVDASCLEAKRLRLAAVLPHPTNNPRKNGT